MSNSFPLWLAISGLTCLLTLLAVFYLAPRVRRLADWLGALTAKPRYLKREEIFRRTPADK